MKPVAPGRAGVQVQQAELRVGHHAQDVGVPRDEQARPGRSQQRPGGRRTFTLSPGRPLTTSHGEDVYDRVFGDASPNGVPATPTTGVAPAEEAAGAS